MTFRSQDMSHFTLIIPRDHAYRTISQMAQLENAHFVDAGDHTNRQFHLQLKRCQQLVQQVNVMKNAAKTAGFVYSAFDQAQPGFAQKICELWHQEAKGYGIQNVKLIDFYETQINEEYARFQQTLRGLEKLKLRRKQLLQSIACSETIGQCFGNAGLKQQNAQFYQNYIGEGGADKMSSICYTVGLIGREAQNRFNLMIYRVSRGYACVRSLDQFKFADLADFNEKVVIVMYPSSSSGTLERKIGKVMQMFCSTVTDIDKNGMKGQGHQAVNLEQLKDQFKETENYISMNEAELKAFFQRICDIRYLQKWGTFAWKQKCVYQTLNKLEMRGQLMLGNIYVPKEKITELSLQLNRMTPSPTLQQVRLGNPPTAFATNCYTCIAQQITDTYGVPRYKEVNPSIFTTITFPFFFGVMFGDIGHGLVLFCLGLYLVINNHWIVNSAFKAFSRMRYMITLMGFFAFYCGWVYNDLIGFSYNFFGSCYDPEQINPDEDDRRIHVKPDCVYPFGLDPIWQRAENQLVYVNSLKMKISVIIAIVHMTFGICVKAMNSLHFKRKLDFYFEFIPQVIFMVVLFGYMDFLIIFKWLQNWDQIPGDVPSRQWAPSIISTMMNIGLAMGKTGVKPDGNSNMWGERGNSWQDTLQMVILVVAFLCVPMMLIPKPYAEISKIKQKKRLANPLEHGQSIESEATLQRSLLTNQHNGPTSLIDSESEVPSPGKQKGQSQNAHEDTSEIVVHQLIETIQFVLGAVSNTASYLRLWALSLAHSQLAKVFFQKTLLNGIELDGLLSIVPNIIFFWLLCWVTFGVLMCMDSMECFLHSLRLHWVEFQNKFYKGDGYKYEPASIQLYLLQKKDEQNK